MSITNINVNYCLNGNFYIKDKIHLNEKKHRSKDNIARSRLLCVLLTILIHYSSISECSFTTPFII